MHTPRQGHTPGPWTAQPTHGNGWGVFATPLQFNVLDNSAPEPINAEANARLIAAAPELLKACEKALAIAEDWIHDQLDGTSSLKGELAKLRPIRKAIAKALGKAS